MRRDLDVVVVGAGVVGLATAAALARAGRDVVVLERHERLAAETSSRNSGVIHAGLYYPEGSHKARLCTRGRELVYARCAEHGIGHRQVGKWVVACEDAEVATLERLCELGTRNGAPGLEVVDGAEVTRAEPHVRAVAGLRSPRTGIVDAHALCLSFAAEAEAHGAAIGLRVELLEVAGQGGGLALTVCDAGGERSTLRCRALVNAAGLEADAVAACAGIDVDAAGYRQHPCKGDYFALAPGAPLRPRGLVYPAPSGPGLGIHVSLDLGGRVRLGPDATYVEVPHYDVEAGKADAFAAAAGRYLPGIEARWLTPDGAGVRPKLAGPGEPFRDFVIAEESARGLPGLINLLGIESPGLTAAPALADEVVALLGAD